MTRTNRAGQALGLGLALACAGSLAHGADSEFSLSTGLEYSSGGYGGTDDIEELYVPVSGTIYLDRVALSVTVPYLSVRTPATTDEVDPIGQPVPASGETITQNGLGDVVVSATVYDVYSNYDRGIALDITGKIKIGSADPDKGLGTGEEDYLLRASIYKFFDQFTLMGSAGYKVRGEPPGVDLRNTALAAVGASFAVSDVASAGMIYDYREASLQDGDAISEVTVYLMRRMTDTWHLQFYAFGGFSDSSPDWGGGIFVSIN